MARTEGTRKYHPGTIRDQIEGQKFERLTKDGIEATRMMPASSRKFTIYKMPTVQNTKHDTQGQVNVSKWRCARVRPFRLLGGARYRNVTDCRMRQGSCLLSGFAHKAMWRRSYLRQFFDRAMSGM